MAAGEDTGWYRVQAGAEHRLVGLHDASGLHLLTIHHPDGTIEAARVAYDDPDDPRVYFEMVTAPPEPTPLTERLLHGDSVRRLPMGDEAGERRRSAEIFQREPPAQRLVLTAVEEELARTGGAEDDGAAESATERRKNYFCRKLCLDSACAGCMKAWCKFTKCLPKSGLLHDCTYEIQQINAYCGGYGGSYVIRRVRDLPPAGR